ncbi:tRNA uridine-5-carboxymethylaminomethyl(34) synthesis GTPase MnmE [Candidatus Bipolaricaulota bacterium]|nr:tRNA uridine-5-carboxymethylaminomethyl(34) synthesis GTPase MnmE [Candidatus Bipolaricaulota bacterium]
MSGVITGDTIAAISTPIGEGGIGIVRLSGSEAIGVVAQLFRSPRDLDIKQVPTHTIHYGHISAAGETIDEVLVSVMRAPHTYTREDVVEINCHGGIVAVRAVLDAVLDAGVRLAEKGEFTKRAFLNGRLSLDQASSVLNIVSAKTKLGLEVAVDQLGGRFSGQIERMREQIASLLARIEVEIDYPDEEIHQEGIAQDVSLIISDVEKLVAASDQGRVLREGLTIAIIGRPNVGKSTLLNALLSEHRAIVTEIPGTTRDTIEEITVIGGVPVRLIDTAGMRAPSDPVEIEGVRRSQEAIKRGDLLLLLLDRSCEMTADDRQLLGREWNRPLFIILNKSDLPHVLEPRAIEPRTVGFPIYEISAETGDGIEELKNGITAELLGGGIEGRNSALLLDTWERDLLHRMQRALVRVAGAIEEESSPDIIAEELRVAHATAGELQGIDASEEVLDQLFRRFCVGK